MAEPVPSASNAVDAADDETTQNLPNNAEDRKAAAALNALNANAMSQEGGETASKQPSAADQEALGKAMSRLEIASGQGKKTDASGKKSEPKKEAEVKKKVKISTEDVSFLVSAIHRRGEWLLKSNRWKSLTLQRTKLQNSCAPTRGMQSRRSKLTSLLQWQLLEDSENTAILLVDERLGSSASCEITGRTPNFDGSLSWKDSRPWLVA